MDTNPPCPAWKVTACTFNRDHEGKHSFEAADDSRASAAAPGPSMVSPAAPKADAPIYQRATVAFVNFVCRACFSDDADAQEHAQNILGSWYG